MLKVRRWPIYSLQKHKSGNFSYKIGIGILTPCCKNITFFKSCVISIDILARASWPMHLLASSVSSSSTLPIFSSNFQMVPLYIHVISIL